MTEQEYRQYINENYSPEEAHLYEAMYNEGKVWDGIKAIGKSLINWSNGPTIGQRRANNYASYRADSEQASEALDKRIGKYTNKASTLDDLSSKYLYALRQFAIDISDVQNNGIFGRGSSAQKTINKEQLSQEDNQRIQTNLKALKDLFPNEKNEKLLLKAARKETSINANTQNIKANLKRKYNFKDSKNLKIDGHLFEALIQNGPMATLLEKWGVTADSNGQLNAEEVFNYLKTLSIPQIKQFTNDFYKLDPRKKSQGKLNLLNNVIADYETMQRNNNTRNAMINQTTVDSNLPTAQQQNNPQLQQQQSQQNGQSLEANDLSKWINSNLGSKLATILRKQGLLQGDRYENVLYCKRAVNYAVSYVKKRTQGKPITKSNLKTIAKPLFSYLSNDYKNDKKIIYNDQQKALANTAINDALSAYLKEALLMSQFLNRYYF